jgi:hypothetical protein
MFFDHTNQKTPTLILSAYLGDHVNRDNEIKYEIDNSRHICIHIGAYGLYTLTLATGDVYSEDITRAKANTTLSDGYVFFNCYFQNILIPCVVGKIRFYTARSYNDNSYVVHMKSISIDLTSHETQLNVWFRKLVLLKYADLGLIDATALPIDDKPAYTCKADMMAYTCEVNQSSIQDKTQTGITDITDITDTHDTSQVTNGSDDHHTDHTSLIHITLQNKNTNVEGCSAANAIKSLTDKFKQPMKTLKRTHSTLNLGS